MRSYSVGRLSIDGRILLEIIVSQQGTSVIVDWSVMAQDGLQWLYL
jgi:hypothetical protein